MSTSLNNRKSELPKQSPDDSVIVADNEILAGILAQIKLTNMYLSLLTDVKLDKCDTE